MSYQYLGQAPDAAAMSRMYAQMFKTQAEQRFAQEDAWNKAEPGIVKKIYDLESQAGGLVKEQRALDKQITQVRTETAAYAEAVGMQQELAAARRMPLWILGGATVVAVILLSRR